MHRAVHFQITQVHNNGMILPEYSDKYNRKLNIEDLDKLAVLISEGRFQEVVDEYNVKQFTTDIVNLSFAPILKLAIESGSVNITKFVYKRLSRDERAYGLCMLDTPVQHYELRAYVRSKVDRPDNHYEQLFGNLRNKHLF